jgi:hypothetical protein
MVKLNLWIAKQAAWLAANPKKALAYWAVSLVAAHLL